ncbi:hypothetical protein C5142_18245 [Rhodococcus sp. BGS-1C]|uniref:hypothetical protein n=1 Tax=Rhodococcus sp. BGS-1C TaxID=2100132 RepID=UPI003DA06148
MAATRPEVIDFLSSLTEGELAKLIDEARPDEKDKRKSASDGDAEADRRFGKKG